MTSRDSLVATAVAKKLKRYLDVQRREQAFDLSHLHNPTVDTLSRQKLLQESQLDPVDLENLTKATLLQHEIGKLSATKTLSEREKQTKLKLQKEMSRLMSRNMAASPYMQPVVNANNRIQNKDDLMKKKRKKRVLSAGRVGRGGYRMTRSAPPQRMSNNERERIINMTTKLLVATENTALPQNQSRGSQTSSEDNFPVIPALRKAQIPRERKEREHLEKYKSSKRIRSANRSVTSEESTRKEIRYPSSILSSSRPKSAFDRSGKTQNIEFVGSSEEEEEEEDSSFEVTPLSTPKRAWEDGSPSNSTTINIGRSNKDFSGGRGLQISSGEDLFFIKDLLYLEERDMSTQTKRKDFPPKVVTYEVYVITGNKLGAETKSKVKIDIFGEYGNTGDRPLIKSKINQIPFQRNQTDMFQLDCIFLGKLSSVRIGHTGTSTDDGWYLEKVIIASSHDSNAQEFLCKKWLSAREGDGQIVRDILLSGMMPTSQLPSVLSNNTSNIRRQVSSGEGFTRGASSSDLQNKERKSTSGNSSSGSSRKESKKSQQGSFTSSSDSEMEKEQRHLEKLKRREKRNSRETDKPKANLGGIINKVGVRNRETPSKTSSKSAKYQNMKSDSQSAVSTNNNSQHDKIERKSSPKDSKQNLEVLQLPQAPSPAANSTLGSVSTISSSSSDSEEDEKLSSSNKQPSQKVEFSNKNTIKKYLESHGSTDDLYMAGFLAGIKANKIQENEEEIESRKKQEFEEKLKNGPTIHQACETGNLERMKELVSLVAELKDKPDERGWAPVHISAAFGYLDLLKWLSVSDVNLTQQTPTGYTAIHLAAMNGHVNCIMILAAMGCPISCRTVDQFTPLHLAAMSGHIECVKWLLSNRAKIDVKDSNNRTPLDLAEEYKHQECIKLLKGMKRELSKKDSVMAMLRDPLALRYNVEPDEFLLQARGADSGVGENEDEEWVSDTEDTSDVVGRGGDDRPESVRRTSVQVGRKESVARKGSRHTSGVSSGKGRRLSKQEIRQSNELEEKKKLYQQQVKKQVTRRTSFLDSIRAEVDENDNT